MISKCFAKKFGKAGQNMGNWQKKGRQSGKTEKAEKGRQSGKTEKDRQSRKRQTEQKGVRI